jgi:hypothetical protein
MEPQNDTNGKQMTGAQMVMEAFVREGVDTIFGLPGGANLPLYDVLESGAGNIPQGVEPSLPIKHYLVKHEQAPRTPLTPTRVSPEKPASATAPPVPALPTSSRVSPTPTWTRSPWSALPAR